VTLLISGFDVSSTQPNLQVLTREPYLQDAMNIFIDNDYQ